MSSRYSSNSRNRPGRPISTNAPTTTPGMLPMPPRITIASAVIETMISKLAGVRDPIFTAKRAPPSEPTAPPVANARSLNRVVLMPMASATCSSSRIAFQARPMREPANRQDKKIANSTNASAR